METTSGNIATKTRYADQELEEFNQLIQRKIIMARVELEALPGSLSERNGRYQRRLFTLEDGVPTPEKEIIHQMAVPHTTMSMEAKLRQN